MQGQCRAGGPGGRCTMRTLVAAMLLTAAAAGCAAADTSTLPRMVVEFSFAPTNTCQGISPEIRLLGVPDGVTTYDVRLTDLDVPGFHHWAQTLGAAGPGSPAGGRAAAPSARARRPARTATRSR